MRTLTKTSDKMPSYIYMVLPSGKADVFVYRLVSEDEEGYTYETNEFRTSLKESEISANPLAFLDYDETKPKKQTPSTVEISREDYDLLDVEEEVMYHIIEADGTITFKKGVNE